METYEQRQLKIEKTDDWIGPLVDMHYKRRKEVLVYARKYLGNPIKQPVITTDLKDPEGVPKFIQALERDVYKPGITKILAL